VRGLLTQLPGQRPARFELTTILHGKPRLDGEALENRHARTGQEIRLRVTKREEAQGDPGAAVHGHRNSAAR
jgi:hypothetical protein